MQAFSITSDFYPKLMLIITNQIVIRKVCVIIQPLQLHRPDHHLSHSQDDKKHPLFHTCPWRINVVNELEYVELHKVLVINVSSHLTDIVPKHPNSLAVEEGMLVCFFETTVSVGAIGDFCYVRFEGHVSKW